MIIWTRKPNFHCPYNIVLAYCMIHAFFLYTAVPAGPLNIAVQSVSETDLILSWTEPILTDEMVLYYQVLFCSMVKLFTNE